MATGPAEAHSIAVELRPEWDDRLPWKYSVGHLAASEILRGSDQTDLVVVSASAPRAPTKGDLQGLLRARLRGHVNPVLVVTAYPAEQGVHYALLGPDEDAVPVFDVDPALVEQLVHDALMATSVSGVQAELRRRLGAIGSGVGSGLRNEGLLASHVLEQQPGTSAWDELNTRGASAAKQRGRALLAALGYAVEAVADGEVLRTKTNNNRTAAAVVLTDTESFDNPLGRLHGASAVVHGLALARREHLDWLIVVGGAVLRLYSADPDVGVGRKGQTQTYVELDLALLPGERSGYLPLLFGPDALADSGTIARLLADSAKYATGLSERLRDRIYVEVIPKLSEAVAGRYKAASLPKDECRAALDEAYHQAMIILFRLLFVAYAEDRQLLPYEISEQYTRNALKTLAQDMINHPERGFDEHSTSLWDDLTQVWKVIDTGDMQGWGVPAYNGGLFTRDAAKNPSGTATYSLNLGNAVVGPVLRGLLIDVTTDGNLGPVDFRSLSVREFGTIYEGLLESGLGVAETDLALDANDTYVPATTNATVHVHAGEVYFHSRSGSRKATGSYFTKPFAVEHLLDTSLEPAIDKHLARIASLLKKGATKSASEALFDFRVADLSMGSAHFLVAAVDRVEARFSAFIAENPLPEVAVELHNLRNIAGSQLDIEPDATGIDDGTLLRRQIARRCIYGLDINEIAVELARLALWIHTFVPGLPLSFLNHGLVWGNSLTGIGSMAEVVEAVSEAELRELRRTTPGQISATTEALHSFLDRAGDALAALGSLSDASVGDVAQASDVQADIVKTLEPIAALGDLITAERVTRHLGNITTTETRYDRYGRNPTPHKVSSPHPDRVMLSAGETLLSATTVDALETAILGHPHLARAREIASTLMATHLPVTFPEVFRRDPAGFDCILGNPPWDKVRHEPQQFWVTRDPGLNALPASRRDERIAYLREHKPVDAEDEQHEQAERQALQEIAKNGYKFLGGGHFDFAKMFAERFISLSRTGGSLGVVLPQAALLLSGWSSLRTQLLTVGGAVCVAECRNTGGWLFENVHHSTAVALVSRRGDGESISILPGLTSRHAFDARWHTTIELTSDDVMELSDTAVIPWFNAPRDTIPFNRMRNRPTLSSGDGWIEGTSDSGRWDFSGSGAHSRYAQRVKAGSGKWLVLKTRHVDAYLITSDTFDKQVDAFELAPLNRGIIVVDGKAVLSEKHPVITYRFPSRNDDSRTVIATALPEAGYLYSTGYAHGIKHPEATEAVEILALLGYLNSVIADWWARRFVDRHVGARIINGLVLPDWDEAQIRQAAGCSRDLLRKGGVSLLAGGIELSTLVPDIAIHNDPRVKLDALAARGFQLTREDVETILSDFSDGQASVAASHRTALLQAIDQAAGAGA